MFTSLSENMSGEKRDIEAAGISLDQRIDQKREDLRSTPGSVPEPQLSGATAVQPNYTPGRPPVYMNLDTSTVKVITVDPSSVSKKPPVRRSLTVIIIVYLYNFLHC